MPEVRPDAILHLMAAKGWSKERLATKAGVNPRTISNLLSGKAFRADTLACVAGAFGVSPAALLVGYEADSAAAVDPDARIRVTIDIPLQAFKQQESLKPWMEAFQLLANIQGNITINDISEGSVKLDLSMAGDDAARLIRAFAAGKLEQAKVTQVAVPRQLIFTLLSGLMTIGAANPLFIPLVPFIGFFLLKQRLRQAGITTTFKDGEVVLTKGDDKAKLPQDTPAGKSSDAAEIKAAIELTTPDYLLPALPCTITLQLEPDEGNQSSAMELGEQLEELLKTRQTLAAGVSRTESPVPWNGSLQLHLQSAAALREMSEVILTHFLDTPTRLTIGFNREFRSSAGEFTMKSRMRMSLSSDVWESVAQEIAGILAEPSAPQSGPDE